MSIEANATIVPVPVTPNLSGSSAEEGKLKLSTEVAIFEPSEKESKEQEPTEKSFATPTDSKAEKGVSADGAALGVEPATSSKRLESRDRR
jgi:hypothetical protein